MTGGNYSHFLGGLSNNRVLLFTLFADAAYARLENVVHGKWLGEFGGAATALSSLGLLINFGCYQKTIIERNVL